MATAHLEMDHEAAKIILKYIWNDRELIHLVDYYFNHCLQILDFYTSLKNCLSRARDSQSSVHLALVHFEEERAENVGGRRYVRTLQELQRFREAGDPFTEEFSKLFRSMCKQQEEMLQKLEACKKKLDKKVKSAQTWRWVTITIFVIVFVSTFILSVVKVDKAWRHVVVTLAAALSGPIVTVGKWCDSWWKTHQRKREGKKNLIDLMNVGTRISIEDLKTIRSLVSKVETEIASILQNADFALREEQEEAVELGILEIKKMVEVVVKTIKDLSIRANKSSREIQTARRVISKRIMGQSSR
ncbi:hypothetical protein EUGRSUZ_H01916 [Eucalyptus grandis]|uniref:Uncharacterized protein n=2 Tax=Eucalyptus grandis TaxID=71139 RepID=A0ACC3JPS5_EUCGR|nr:hypothetical protein EUGRSUZ_H01916 [Eucalyptus grandis]